MTRPPFDDEAPTEIDARAEVRAFAPEQLVACPACLRANAPTRMRCLYCGAALPVASDAAADLRRPALRALEAWEQGYNIVLLPRAESTNISHADLSEAASLARVEPEQLERMLAARVALPLARTVERAEAELFERKLAALNLRVEIVSDEQLALQSPPQRIRRLAFDDEGLTAWSHADGESQRALWSEVALLVVGRIRERQIEVEERQRRTQRELVEAREFQKDEGALDIYTTDAPRHWRIMAESFDYTCLGARKGLLAAENFTRLVALLRERPPAAVCDEEYNNLRPLLRAAWPVAERTTSSGVRRNRGRLRLEAVTSVSNEEQFTRYSRLRRHFVLRTHETATQAQTETNDAAR